MPKHADSSHIEETSGLRAALSALLRRCSAFVSLRLFGQAPESLCVLNSVLVDSKVWAR